MFSDGQTSLTGVKVSSLTGHTTLASEASFTRVKVSSLANKPALLANRRTGVFNAVRKGQNVQYSLKLVHTLEYEEKNDYPISYQLEIGSATPNFGKRKYVISEVLSKANKF